MTKVPNKVMTVREVSAYLRVHPATIYRLLKKHEISAFQVGSDWRLTSKPSIAGVGEKKNERLAGKDDRSTRCARA